MFRTFRQLGQETNTRDENRYGKAPAYLQNTARRVSGYVQLNDPVFGIQQGETYMCMHCQAHWVIQPGSGITRGFCLRCNGPTCGKQPCETKCVPWEKAMDLMEAGKAV